MLLNERDRLEPDDFTTLTRSVITASFKLPAEALNVEEVARQLSCRRSNGRTATRGRRDSC
jgi:hypothetical protein